MDESAKINPMDDWLKISKAHKYPGYSAILTTNAKAIRAVGNQLPISRVTNVTIRNHKSPQSVWIIKNRNSRFSIALL